MLCAIGCGNWNNAGNAGASARNLNNNRTNSNNNVSGRADSAPSSNSILRQWSTGIGCPGILLALLSDKIKDERLLGVMEKFLGPFPRGLVLGNLLSQLYALIYLNPVDHYVKRELKVKRYVRYVDDMIFVGLGKQEALDVRGKVERYLADHLKLGLSKWAMRKVRDGINFVGYRTWPSHRLIRKFSLQKFRRAVRDNKDETAWSIIAHAQRTSSVAAIRRLISCRPAMLERLPAAHKVRLGIC